MILILGAGPAGLSAAYHLDSGDYLILEREAEPGGLCRSFDLAGVTFDLGGHAFFTRHDYVRRLVTELCEEGLYTQPRQAWVHAYDTFVRYPFQSNLHGLPTPVVRDCLAGLVEAVAKQRDGGSVAHVRDWIDRTFGPGIARHFLVPYNEKIWAHPLDEVSPEWTSARIVTPDLPAIIEGALTERRYEDFPNAEVAYPASGGFFNLYRGFLRHVGDRVRTSTEVVEIDVHARRVRLADGAALAYDHLLSTMPLDVLVERAPGLDESCRQATRSLRYNSLHLVNLVFDKPCPTAMQRIYSADPDIPFHKLVLNSNSSQELRERPRFGVQAEVSFSPYKKVDRANLERRVLQALCRLGVVEADEPVVASSVLTVDRAYPVHGPDTADARRHLFDTLAPLGITCAGRFGEWLYINSDDAVMRGRERAAEIATPPGSCAAEAAQEPG